jgi:L-histidine Nalpha-methyltransferase / hercynylcysteine S-oxide synthase
MALRPDILDVRFHTDDGPHSREGIAKQVIQGLLRPVNTKSLPTLLLYDERGLRFYDDITTEAPEYYLFGAEEDILKNYANEIVQIMHARVQGKVDTEEVVLELGAG